MTLGRRDLVLATLALPILAATRAQAATWQVTIQGFAFAPASFRVNAGDTVVFVNADRTVHTATAEDGAFDTGEIAPGARVQVTIPAGQHAFFCRFHPRMKGVATAA